MHQVDRIIVLDFGGQYAHLLARRVRELGVYSQIMLPDATSKELKSATGIILSGGPSSVYDETAVKFNKKIFSFGIPILGLCYGQQLIGHELGGIVKPGKVKEYGKAMLHVQGGKLFEGTPKDFMVWMSHGDKVQKLPKGFSGIASTTDCEYAAISNDEKKIYGLQFHPEVTHTQNGLRILSNFVFGVCKADKNWSMRDYLNEEIARIKKEASGKNVFLLLSGGVDSTVALALLVKALGSKRVHALHVDTGFMRKSESKLVKRELEKIGAKEINVIDASVRFYSALEGIVEPEEKRGIIGKVFVDVAIEELEKLGLNSEKWLLGQGTIYPDTIETGGTKNSQKIKTHHNRAPIIMKMIQKGMVIEPLKSLYKDEVRELGKILGLPPKLVMRHPFPGPGLAIRILCSEGNEKIDIDAERKINALVMQSGYSTKLLPIKAVGVQGDNRTYRNAVLLEGKLDYDTLDNLSTKITNAFNNVNRVIYLIAPQKSGWIKLEKAYLTRERIEKLREADSAAMEILSKNNLEGSVWQFPVVLLPVDFGSLGEGVVLRPVESLEAMTARFACLPENILNEMAEKIMKVKCIGAVMLDVTHKPPATIEWE